MRLIDEVGRSMKLDNQGHLVELQSIRGVAALIVVLRHSSMIYDGSPGWWSTAVWLFNDDAAVSIFFVLSGYVLTRMLMDRPITLNTNLDFWLRRVFRIYPALIAISAVSLCYALFYHHYHLSLSGWFQHYFTRDRQGPVQIVLAFAGISAHLLPPVWTVAVELLASLLMPSAVWFAIRYRKAFLCLLAAALIAGFLGRDTPYSIGLYLPFFGVGIWIYFMPSGLRLALERLAVTRKWFWLAVILLLCVRVFPIPTRLVTLEELCSITFILAILIHGKINIESLRHPRVVWLGNISYSLYLVHYLVIYALATVLTPLQRSGVDVLVVTWITMPATVMMSLPLAAWCYRWVEYPGNRMGRDLVKWIGARRSQGVVTSATTGIAALSVGDKIKAGGAE